MLQAVTNSNQHLQVFEAQEATTAVHWAEEKLLQMYKAVALKTKLLGIILTYCKCSMMQLILLSLNGFFEEHV